MKIILHSKIDIVKVLLCKHVMLSYRQLISEIVIFSGDSLTSLRGATFKRHLRYTTFMKTYQNTLSDPIIICFW